MKWTVRSFKSSAFAYLRRVCFGLKTKLLCMDTDAVGEVHSQVAKRQDNNQAEL
uniref:Uncharacterized protein n=1 Tax=Anguilla anguilla TaxID=7936 RepID=A0A0E9QKN7_ANGAN